MVDTKTILSIAKRNNLDIDMVLSKSSEGFEIAEAIDTLVH